FIRMDAARLALNLTGPIADMQRDAVLLVPLPLRQHELFRATVREERRQANTVIGSTRLFTERDDSALARHIILDQLFAKTLSHHAVANDHDGLLLTCSVPGSAHGLVLSLLEESVIRACKSKRHAIFLRELRQLLNTQ